MSEHTGSSDHAEHDRLWNDRLQDWLDADRQSPGAAAFEAHLDKCQLCKAELAAFAELDTALHGIAPPIALDDTFNIRLFNQIDALDESSRLQARQRMELELQANLRSLSRRWRHNLAFVVPGVIAGIAVALALVGWFDNSGVSQQLVAEGTHELGPYAGNYVQMLVTALLGAGVGLAVANWLATVAD